MSDSVFTKIIRAKFLATRSTRMIKPSLYGYSSSPTEYVLVVSKQQVEYIWDLSDEDYSSLMNAVHRIGNRVREILKPTYVGISVEGNGVAHTHVHIIPFETQAEFHHLADQDAEPDHAALAKMAQKLSF